MLFFVTFMLVSLLILLGTSIRRKQRRLKDLIQHGLKHLEAGDLAEAQMHLFQAMVLHSGMPKFSVRGNTTRHLEEFVRLKKDTEKEILSQYKDIIGSTSDDIRNSERKLLDKGT